MKRYKNCRFRNLNHRSTICQHFCQWTNILALSPTLAGSWATLFEEKSILNLYLIFEKRSLQKEIRITHKNCKTYLPDSELKCVFYICVLHVFVSPITTKNPTSNLKNLSHGISKVLMEEHLKTQLRSFTVHHFHEAPQRTVCLTKIDGWIRWWFLRLEDGESSGWTPNIFRKNYEWWFFWWKHKLGGLLESCLWLTDASLHLWVIKYH